MQQGSCRIVGGWQQGDGIFIDAEFLQYALDEAYDGTVAVVSILTALQNASATGFQTEREYIKRHVGTCFIDDADDAEGNAHTLEVESVGERRVLQHLAKRGGECGHIARVASDALHALLRQFQTVVHGVGRIHACQILGVGGQDGIGFADGFVSHSHQDFVDGLVVEQCEVNARILCCIEGLKK